MLKSWGNLMAYKNNETMRLEEVKNLGIEPNNILDIGAHTGQFYGWAKKVWPTAVVFMIEANILHKLILKNITFGIDDEDINMNRVHEVIKDTNLDSFVKNLHNGLNTKLGNMGANLSGGQIQRIGIARALYRNPEMLILDEPTSAVDKDTEREILSNLKGSKFSKKIIVIISHNLRILKNCNKAILLKNKKIFKEFNDSNIKKLSETELLRFTTNKNFNFIKLIL